MGSDRSEVLIGQKTATVIVENQWVRRETNQGLRTSEKEDTCQSVV